MYAFLNWGFIDLLTWNLSQVKCVVRGDLMHNYGTTKKADIIVHHMYIVSQRKRRYIWNERFKLMKSFVDISVTYFLVKLMFSTGTFWCFLGYVTLCKKVIILQLIAMSQSIRRQSILPDHRAVIRGSNPAKIRRPSADFAPILDSSGGDPANLTRS